MSKSNTPKQDLDEYVSQFGGVEALVGKTVTIRTPEGLVHRTIASFEVSEDGSVDGTGLYLKLDQDITRTGLSNIDEIFRRFYPRDSDMYRDYLSSNYLLRWLFLDDPDGEHVVDYINAQILP